MEHIMKNQTSRNDGTNIICPEPTALIGLWCVSCGWNKFHPYNIKRAYGSDVIDLKCQPINPIGMIYIVATDFNPLTWDQK